MKILKFTLLLIGLNTFDLIAQTKREFGFVTDNDLYVSIYLDQYYTNGLELFYKEVTITKLGDFDKKIKCLKLGQNIYNPYQVDVKKVAFQDRPYAGYLYTSYSEQFINKKNLLTFRIEFGLTGKKTGAEEIQNFVHQFYGIPASDGWKTQVKQKISLGIHINYVYSLHHKPESRLQASLTNSAVLNFVFTNISSGVALKYNISGYKTTSIANTSFFNTGLQVNNESWIKESYLGVKSYITYQINDRTITGELHNNLTQKKFNIQPWIWNMDIGYYWNLKKWNISYHQIFYTKNAQEINKKWIRYGSIQFSYKF